MVEKPDGAGMSVVSRAEDSHLRRFVSLNFLPEHAAGDPQALARFQREAQAAYALNYPNFGDIGEWNDQAFISAEFLDGLTLNPNITILFPEARPGNRTGF
jgi:serine/threonine protein kinase